MKGMKALDSETDAGPPVPPKHTRSFSLGAQRFPETWWNTVPDTLAEPKNDTDADAPVTGGVFEAQTSSLDNGEAIVASEKSVNEQSGLMLFSSRVMSASFEKVFKMGINKLIPRRQSLCVSQPQSESVPTDPNREHDTHAPDLPQLPSDANIESVDNLPVNKLHLAEAETETRSIDQQSSSGTCTSSSRSPSQDEDMISDIDSVFGVLISVDNNQEKETKTPVNINLGTVADKSWPPLTAPSTPVSNAYAEVRAYIITNFAENTATAAARRAAGSSGVSDYSDKPYQSVVPVPKSEVKRGDAVSIKSDSAHILKKPGTLPPPKYMTWNGPTRVSQEPMRSTLEFGLELERVLRGEKENMELFAGRATLPAVKYGQ